MKSLISLRICRVHIAIFTNDSKFCLITDDKSICVCVYVYQHCDNKASDNLIHLHYILSKIYIVLLQRYESNHAHTLYCLY